MALWPVTHARKTRDEHNRSLADLAPQTVGGIDFFVGKGGNPPKEPQKPLCFKLLPDAVTRHEDGRGLDFIGTSYL